MVASYSLSDQKPKPKDKKSFQSYFRQRQEYFAVYREYADRHKNESISANFRAKPKKFISKITFLDMIERARKHLTLLLILGKNDVKCAPNERSGRGHEES